MPRWATTNYLRELMEGTYKGEIQPEFGRRCLARIAAPCSACGNTLMVGDRIAEVRFGSLKRRWIHEACKRRISERMASPPVDAPDRPDLQSPEPETPPADPRPFNGMTDQLTDLIKQVAGELDGLVSKESSRAVADLSKRIEELQVPAGPTEIVVKDAGGAELKTIEGVAHPALQDAVTLATQRLPTLLVGPAGSGKTTLASQVAEVLGLRFSSISCTSGMSEGQLLGRLLPIGEGVYLPAEFIDYYENGGVYLLDEVDAADANVMLVLNSAISNGSLSVPNRTENPKANRHEDFVLLAAANTFGSGADRVYVGRNQLDEAFLDRFRIGTLELDYNPELEAAVCPDSKLLKAIQSLRQAAADAKLRRVVSMRFAKDAYSMLQVGWSREKCLRQLTLGWSESERKRIEGAK